MKAYHRQPTSHGTQDPTNFTGSPAQKALVVGGEFSLWSEYIDSSAYLVSEGCVAVDPLFKLSYFAANLLSRGWPSGAAVAERLWSPSNVTSIADASVRIQGHTCRLVARGIAAEPPSGPGFCANEFAFVYVPPYQP